MVVFCFMEVFQCLFRGSVKNYEKPQSVFLIMKYDMNKASFKFHYFVLTGLV
jgi:hypothetical protein